MRVFELTEKKNINKMSAVQQQFTAKMVVREVQKIAKEKNISEEEAYWGYTHGYTVLTEKLNSKKKEVIFYE